MRLENLQSAFVIEDFDIGTIETINGIMGWTFLVVGSLSRDKDAGGCFLGSLLCKKQHT